ncbi:transposase family protein [Pseudonocardia sp. CA-142604]|uniref:transposase family protein n=1 Tax=Pseudonocardia sp. CA-142604 TaxID=3240024 RepID=UPI003D8BDB51
MSDSDRGRLVRVSPTLPGARHDISAAREHGIIDAIHTADVHAVADTGYQGAGPNVAAPQRRRRLDPDTGRYRRLSVAQKEVNTAHTRRTRRAGDRQAHELEGALQDPLQPQPAHRACPSRSDTDHRVPKQVGKGSMTQSAHSGAGEPGIPDFKCLPLYL